MKSRLVAVAALTVAFAVVAAEAGVLLPPQQNKTLATGWFPMLPKFPAPKAPVSLLQPPPPLKPATLLQPKPVVSLQPSTTKPAALLQPPPLKPPALLQPPPLKPATLLQPSPPKPSKTDRGSYEKKPLAQPKPTKPTTTTTTAAIADKLPTSWYQKPVPPEPTTAKSKVDNDRTVITAGLKSCPPGQQRNPDRICEPVQTDPDM